jgi:mono/diheme cytochrome c family protein
MRRAISGSITLVMAVVLTSSPALAQGNAAKGKELFAKHCGGCHGPSGKGDGPAAAALTPKPSDLTNKTYVAGLTDQYLFDLIQKGGAAVGKSPLIPPFGSKLKDGEIRDVVAHIRNLAK